MVPEVRRLSTGQFASLLGSEASRLTRKIVAVHLHHTWRPTRSQFKGLATIEAMRNFHVNTNGWNDIAQHLTIDPQGMVWTGRNWNLAPASQSGRNGTRQQGPFMIEIVGDFDTGRDLLDGTQRQAVIDVSAALLDVCGLTTAAVMFHRELGSPKTCPGTGVDKPTLLREIQTALTARRGGRAAPRGKAAKRRRKPATDAARVDEGMELPVSREFLLGGAAAEPATEITGFESWEVQENDVAAQAIEDDARARVRLALGDARDPAVALARTKLEWHVLRPYVVNLSQGRLSQGGEFDMPAGAIDGIVDAISQYAQTTANPRLMMHAHGGLVGEKSALGYALTAHRWWLQHGVFPLYFIWETSAFEVLKNRLGLGRAVGDWWDRRFEAFARPLAKPLWSDMKEYALLSSSADAGGGEAGGARIFAQALAPLIKNPPGGKPISLHAVGHSAGTIFHTHFVPALIDAGMKVDSVAFLAAAVRVDLFKQMLVPHISGGGVRRFAMYGMDAEAERDDDCVAPLGVPVYGKSLLYLVSGAFEPEPDAAILGLEDRFRDDPGVMALFPPKGAHRLELSHARGKAHNPATKARKHGCFDNDDATMRSVFQIITGAATHVPFAVRDPDCEKASSRAFTSAAAGVPGYFPGVPSPAARPGSGADGGNGRRRALCVGIDSYPTSPLAGCVRDAQTWAAALRSLQFEVTTVLDLEAKRQRVLDALTALVEGARPGDTIVFQYSGHGTQADDLNGDESDRYDEAMVPIDYQTGALLLDDDLADVYRRLPSGAVLTLFMDCCHSGTNSRFAPIDRSVARGSERRRFLQLSAEQQAAHRQFRERAGSPAPTTPEESLPGVIHFAACLDNQFAYESSGQGHFTGIAASQIAAAVAGSVTNESFMNDVAAKVIALGRPQTPRLMRLPADLTGRVLLGATAAAGIGAPEPVAAPGQPLTDRAFDEWCLQFFEDGAARWRQRLGR